MKKGTKGQSVKLMQDTDGKLVGSIYRHKTKYQEPEVTEEPTEPTTTISSLFFIS